MTGWLQQHAPQIAPPENIGIDQHIDKIEQDTKQGTQPQQGVWGHPGMVIIQMLDILGHGFPVGNSSTDMPDTALP